jgi:hypothetical protein
MLPVGRKGEKSGEKVKINRKRGKIKGKKGS